MDFLFAQNFAAEAGEHVCAAVSHPVMWDFLTMHAKTSCVKYPHYNPFHVEFFPHSNRMPKPKSKLELKPHPNSARGQKLQLERTERCLVEVRRTCHSPQTYRVILNV